MQIRRATRADLAALTALNEQVHAIHVAERPDYFCRPEPAAVSKWLGGMLDDPTIAVWIAHLEDTPVGYVLLMVKERPANPFCQARVTAEIDQIAVHQSVRGTGVGTALIRAAIAHADARDIENVELNVWAFNNAARAAFEHLGFTARTLTMERIRDRSPR